jgi:hypothetical protein
MEEMLPEKGIIPKGIIRNGRRVKFKTINYMGITTKYLLSQLE